MTDKSQILILQQTGVHKKSEVFFHSKNVKVSTINCFLPSQFVFYTLYICIALVCLLYNIKSSHLKMKLQWGLPVWLIKHLHISLHLWGHEKTQVKESRRQVEGNHLLALSLCFYISSLTIFSNFICLCASLRPLETFHTYISLYSLSLQQIWTNQ